MTDLDRARRALGEIPGLAWDLNQYAPRAGDPEAPVIARAKVGTGPALVRLDVLALTDPRTTWDGEPGSPRYWRAALTDWDHRAADLLRLDRGPGVLLTWWEILAGQQEEALAELAEEILGLHGQLRAALGTPRRKEGSAADVGECECGGRLLAGPDLVPVCKACGRRRDTVTVAEAARILDCTERAVWQRAKDGRLTRTRPGQVSLASVLDLRRRMTGADMR